MCSLGGSGSSLRRAEPLRRRASAQGEGRRPPSLFLPDLRVDTLIGASGSVCHGNSRGRRPCFLIRRREKEEDFDLGYGMIARVHSRNDYFGPPLRTVRTNSYNDVFMRLVVFVHNKGRFPTNQTKGCVNSRPTTGKPFI